jgi:cobalamin biosynthesis Mg chelatase CobN
VLLALVSKGGSLADDADAQVDIALRGSTSVDAAREQIIADATRSWKATRVAESSESDDEATVEFALPGASLDGFVAALRRQTDAESVEVALEVDPEQVQPDSLAGDPGSEAAPKPVRVKVNLTSSSSQGPLVTFIGALLVAVLAALALGLVWRRFGHEDQVTSNEPTGEIRSRRWINRP